MAAAAVGNVEMMKTFLERRSIRTSLNRAESRNWTALCFASQQGHTGVVTALLEAGADAGHITGAGLSPWMLAKDAQQASRLACLFY